MALCYVGIGEKVRTNREREASKQGERYGVTRFGRLAASIRAGALISWSARPFILGRSAETEFYTLVLSIKYHLPFILLLTFVHTPNTEDDEGN